ncbi:glycerophosphodiester phosphodiesterase family protein [Aquimarina longa]|uniref:glycerophosphodiester phosphodiesterase family protein n=1 Tax=Aquimarina longa TaxID=1080221 RepID=UPI00078180EA|nr:glycerophosphodiester phosphodiesterase family protein [Aquimarina longa]
MKKILIYCLNLFVFAGYFADATAQEKINSIPSKTTTILKQLKNPGKNHVLVVSHRGDWRYAPENSLKAIERCIDLGVDIVEIDVRLTKDKYLVLMHDATVDRTTDGSGKVSDFTLAEIKKLRLKNACGIRGSSQQVPTLEEVMFLTKDKIMVNLDKVEGATVQEAYNVLKKTKTVDQAIFKGRKTAKFMIDKYGSLMDSIIYMPIVLYDLKNPSKFISDYKKTLAPIAYEMLFDSETSQNLKEIKKLNEEHTTVLNIALWDELCAGYTDEKMLLQGPDASWGWLINNGANAIMTDRPEALLKYVRQKKLHD